MQISRKPSIEPIFYILNNLHSTGLHSIKMIIKIALSNNLPNANF